MKYAAVAQGIGWLIGVGALGALGAFWAADMGINVFTMVTVFVSGFSVLLLSEIIQRNPRLQLLTWTPLPIAFVVALWIIEDVPRDHMIIMSRAAFATSLIGVVFDVVLLRLFNLPGRLLWPIVLTVTLGTSVGVYYAAGDESVAFIVGIMAAALNVQNIPHMEVGDDIACACAFRLQCCCPLQTNVIVVPFVWVLLTASVLLQELGEYRVAGMVSNMPCLHFVVASALWYTSHDASKDKDSLKERVVSMVDNIGIGSVAVFSSSVFTIIFLHIIKEDTWGIWTAFGTAVGASLLVSLVFYFATTRPVGRRPRPQHNEVAPGA